jgi:hypothetical protein
MERLDARQILTNKRQIDLESGGGWSFSVVDEILTRMYDEAEKLGYEHEFIQIIGALKQPGGV